MNLECPIVFVIDDDASVRRAVCRLLRAEGFCVETFASGLDFLRALDCSRKGCVLLDVRMPGLSGFEVLESLNARGRTLPVILITGHGDVPMAVRAMKVGCVSFLAKPFEDEALLGAVRDALRDQDEAGSR
jgi:two-component system response regulator FixJ